MLTINYGINKRLGRRRFAHQSGKLRVKGSWVDRATQQKIRCRILDKHPGWCITGYALAPAKKPRHVFMVSARFVPLVLSGEKYCTIRPIRKRMPKPGDLADIRAWAGLPYRSKQIKLRTEEIRSVCEIDLETSGDFRISGHLLRWDLRELFAQRDGFASADELLAWFKETHGRLPFTGFMTEWIT